MLFLDCHTYHILVTETELWVRGLSRCAFSFRSWSVRIFFLMSISAERRSIKWRVFLFVWHLETLREFLPLISLKLVTAAAEEVAALGLFLECGIRGLACAGWLPCCTSHFYFGLWLNINSKGWFCADFSHIYYSLSMPLPLSLASMLLLTIIYLHVDLVLTHFDRDWFYLSSTNPLKYSLVWQTKEVNITYENKSNRPGKTREGSTLFLGKRRQNITTEYFFPKPLRI